MKNVDALWILNMNISMVKVLVHVWYYDNKECDINDEYGMCLM